MTEVGWSLANGYLLQGFAHHDGTIRTFHYGLDTGDGPQRRSLVIDVDNVQGETIRIRFFGVEILRVTELWEGSIINDVHVAKLSDPIVMQMQFEAFWHDLKEDTASVARLVSRFGNHLAVHLHGSYGCGLSLLCEGLQVLKILPSPPA